MSRNEIKAVTGLIPGMIRRLRTNQVSPERLVLYALFLEPHSRRDLLNVMDFDLQLGGFLGIMSVKGFWKKTS